jgi:hypothetical protein
MRILHEEVRINTLSVLLNDPSSQRSIQAKQIPVELLCMGVHKGLGKTSAGATQVAPVKNTEETRVLANNIVELFGSNSALAARRDNLGSLILLLLDPITVSGLNTLTESDLGLFGIVNELGAKIGLSDLELSGNLVVGRKASH